MAEINNCENCHHYNSLINWNEGIFHQCLLGNKLWVKCKDYDAIEKRYTIKAQDDLFGVLDNYSADKVCVVNGIRTEIEAEWLCNEMNDLNDEKEQLKKENQQLRMSPRVDVNEIESLVCENEQLKNENELLKIDKQQLNMAMSRENVRHKEFRDKVFNLINNSLEKYKHHYEMTSEDYLKERIDVLEDLKMELLDD